MRLTLEELGAATIEQAATLVASEHAAARRRRPELPVSYAGAGTCAAALQRLLDSGHRGIVAVAGGRPLAVMAATIREVRPVGRYARMPAEGVAVDPALDDPTAALGAVYAELAQLLIADGVLGHYLLHVAEPRLADAVANLGFGRDGVYGVQAVSQRVGSSAITIRVADLDDPADLETVCALALVELRHRSAPPMFTPAHDPAPADLPAEHRALRDNGAVHLLAAADGRDVGLLTIEPSSPVPRLCPVDQPYIGPTATLPSARRQGVGRALVDAAMNWARQHDAAAISVDFAAANLISRPFWLAAGFRPTGYGVLRRIDPTWSAATAEPDTA